MSSTHFRMPQFAGWENEVVNAGGRLPQNSSLPGAASERGVGRRGIRSRTGACRCRQLAGAEPPETGRRNATASRVARRPQSWRAPTLARDRTSRSPGRWWAAVLAAKPPRPCSRSAELVACCCRPLADRRERAHDHHSSGSSPSPSVTNWCMRRDATRSANRPIRRYEGATSDDATPWSAPAKAIRGDAFADRSGPPGAVAMSHSSSPTGCGPRPVRRGPKIDPATVGGAARHRGTGRRGLEPATSAGSPRKFAGAVDGFSSPARAFDRATASLAHQPSDTSERGRRALALPRRNADHRHAAEFHRRRLAGEAQRLGDSRLEEIERSRRRRIARRKGGFRDRLPSTQSEQAREVGAEFERAIDELQGSAVGGTGSQRAAAAPRVALAEAEHWPRPPHRHGHRGTLREVLVSLASASRGYAGRQSRGRRALRGVIRYRSPCQSGWSRGSGPTVAILMTESREASPRDRMTQNRSLYIELDPRTAARRPPGSVGPGTSRWRSSGVHWRAYHERHRVFRLTPEGGSAERAAVRFGMGTLRHVQISTDCAGDTIVVG